MPRLRRWVLLSLFFDCDEFPYDTSLLIYIAIECRFNWPNSDSSPLTIFLKHLYISVVGSWINCDSFNKLMRIEANIKS